jgi:hypothetical protein
MDKPRYTVEIVIAAPGTPLIDPRTHKQAVDAEGIPQTSAPGHMFYVLHAPGVPAKSYGFAPKEHGSVNGPGTIMEDDATVYKDPRYTRTLEISEDQYRKLQQFGSDPEKFGFSKHYQDVRHNCVDFTWEALNHAGIERKRSIDVNALGGPAGQLLPDVRIPLDIKGAGKDGFRPLRNIHGVDSIDPPFPDSELTLRAWANEAVIVWPGTVTTRCSRRSTRAWPGLMQSGAAASMPPARTSAPACTPWPRQPD